MASLMFTIQGLPRNHLKAAFTVSKQLVNQTTEDNQTSGQPTAEPIFKWYTTTNHQRRPDAKLQPAASVIVKRHPTHPEASQTP
jgi:hypothetical protein